MSYKVLARKWRPQEFAEVVGQEHVVKALTNALDQEKVHQAYVLSGTRGVGKTTIARILSKSLNCEEGLDSKPCNSCQTCISISEGSFMDFQEIDAASNRGVDETEKLLETVVHMPSSSRYKVYLLDEVHMLSTQSFNMLLKTLEEPPQHVVFILATTLPEKIPATVLSRCLHFSLKNLTQTELAERISLILEKEGVSFEKDAVSLICRAGRGSLRDSLTITDQAIAYSKNKLEAKEVAEMLGTLPSDQIDKFLNSIIKKDGSALLKDLNELKTVSVDYQNLIDRILENIQYLAYIKISEDSISEIDANKETLLKMSKQITQEEIQLLYQIGLIAKRDMDLAPEISSGFEMALLRMVSFLPDNMISEEGSVEGIQKKKLTNTNSKDKTIKNTQTKIILKEDEDLPSKAKQNNNDKKNLSTMINKKNWSKIFKELTIDPGTKQLASHCSLLKVDGSVIYFSMPEEKLNLFNGNHRQDLQESISEYIKLECNLFFEEGSFSADSPNQDAQREKKAVQVKAKKTISEDPNVKEILKNFEAELVDSSIKPLGNNE
tara:strand:+ start:71918 stop:73570 length:1653 start_codon:yes stop_codon:yes gene_type:complete